MWRIFVLRKIVLKMMQSQLLIKGVIRAEIKNNENLSEVLNQDQTDAVSGIISLHATWQDLDDLSLIQRMRRNCNDSNPGVSSQPLIKNETENLTVTPKFAIN